MTVYVFSVPGRYYDSNTIPLLSWKSSDRPSFLQFIISSRASQSRFAYSLRINRFGKMVMPYKRCTRVRTECRLLSGSKKCGEYTRAGVSCNAQDDCLAAFARIEKERRKLKLKLRETKKEEGNLLAAVSQLQTVSARRLRLKTQLRSLKEKEVDLIVRGANTLADIDALGFSEDTPAAPPLPPLKKLINAIPDDQWDDFFQVPPIVTSEEVPYS